MVVVNVRAVISPLGIVKIVACLCGLLIASLMGNQTGSKFYNDRSNFAVTVGVMILLWSLVTLLLHLFSVTSKCQPETVRTMELVGAVFLLVMTIQSWYYTIQATLKFKERAELIEHHVKQDLKNPATSVYFSDPYDCPTFSNLDIDLDYHPKPKSGQIEQAHINKQEECRDQVKKKSNLCAAASFFIGLAIVLFVVTIVIAKKCDMPGTPTMEGAHV